MDFNLDEEQELVRRSTRALCSAILPLCAVVACSSPPAAHDPGELRPGRSRPGGEHGPKIAAEVGALDEEAVQQAFDGARATIGECFVYANDGLHWPIVGGDVEVVVRVRNDRSVHWMFPRRSTLGDREAERCILEALQAQRWPKPQGGEEGIARTVYGRDAPGREPVQWSVGDLGRSGAKLRAKLRACDRAGGGLSVTVYVDPNGKPISAGAACDDERGIEALDCAVQAAKSLRYPSPGSYPAKVTISSR